VNLSLWALNLSRAIALPTPPKVSPVESLKLAGMRPNATRPWADVSTRDRIVRGEGHFVDISVTTEDGGASKGWFGGRSGGRREGKGEREEREKSEEEKGHRELARDRSSWASLCI
jgi:hypothetical protein